MSRLIFVCGSAPRLPYNNVAAANTSTNAAVRDAATDAIKKLSEWSVGVDYREDVYHALKSFSGTKPQLTSEDKKLFDETLRDYRRAGLELPALP